MRRQFRALGLACVSALAISSLWAANALSAEFHFGEAHTVLKGLQSTTHVFTAGSGFGGVTCTTATLNGTTFAATETELTFEPSYSGCKDSFGRTAHIDTNNCKYRFHATAGSGSTYTGNFDIVGCSGEDPEIQLQITPGGLLGECKVGIGEQNNVGPIAFHNVANGDIRFDFAANNVNNVTAGGLFNCGVGNGLHKEGTFNGDTVIFGMGTSEFGAVNIFVG